jgi:hypothetical protein
MMEKYEQEELSPLQHRSSHYETVDEGSTKGEFESEKLHFADDERIDPTDVVWTDELVEDYFDAMAPINDQLVQAKGWWVLEFWPIKVRIQREGQDDWEKKVSMNMGRFRAVQDTDPRMHWTVKQRMVDKRYRLRTRVDRNAVWSAVV